MQMQEYIYLGTTPMYFLEASGTHCRTKSKARRHEENWDGNSCRMRVKERKRESREEAEGERKSRPSPHTVMFRNARVLSAKRDSNGAGATHTVRERNHPPTR